MPDVGIIIGELILWLYVIVTNREIAWSISFFGETSVDKGTRLSSQLNSPGVVLFYIGEIWFDIMISGSNMFITITPVCAYRETSLLCWLVAPLTIILTVGLPLAIPHSLIRNLHDAMMGLDESGHDVEAVVEDVQIDVDIVELQ
jgi:hypothetical protein